MTFAWDIREQLATNPDDHRQKTHRFGATWGKPRITQKGTIFQKHYADLLDDVVLEPDPIPGIPPDRQLILNAKQWAYKKYKYLDQEDISQEIEIKAWQLEETEKDGDTWFRPGYVMTALMNVVHDMNRREQTVNTIVDRMKSLRHFETIEEQVDYVFTKKTLKAALLLFMVQPTRLRLTTKDRIYMIYRNLTTGEHRQLLQECVAPTSTSTRVVDRIVSKYIDNV